MPVPVSAILSCLDCICKRVKQTSCMTSRPDKSHDKAAVRSKLTQQTLSVSIRVFEQTVEYVILSNN